MSFLAFISKFADNKIMQLVVVAIVCDTVFGLARAIKEKELNSCFGIDGAIRKVGMLAAIFFLGVADLIISVNLIGFIPETIRNYLPTQTVGLSDFFGILFIAYESVSILKNMTLCGLPVQKIWTAVEKFLDKYTEELPAKGE